jgi:hypothetical protein
METIWEFARRWNEGQISHLVDSAVLFAHSGILSDLIEPPKRRISLSKANFELAYYSELLARVIDVNQTQAAEFWPEPIEDFLQKLRTFSGRQYERELALRHSIENISMPSRRGRGKRREIAYGNAIARALESIGALSRKKQDQVIAVLTNVVFHHSDVAELAIDRIRTRRKRGRLKTRT